MESIWPLISSFEINIVYPFISRSILPNLQPTAVAPCHWHVTLTFYQPYHKCFNFLSKTLSLLL